MPAALCLQMKMFMVCAVLETIIPRIRNAAPINATYRRPIRSDREPTNGQTAANASKLARTLYRSAGHCDLGLLMLTHKPDPSISASNITVDVGWNAAWESSAGICESIEEADLRDITGFASRSIGKPLQ